jgi:hypothetical protein
MTSASRVFGLVEFGIVSVGAVARIERHLALCIGLGLLCGGGRQGSRRLLTLQHCRGWS